MYIVAASESNDGLIFALYGLVTFFLVLELYGLFSIRMLLHCLVQFYAPRKFVLTGTFIFAMCLFYESLFLTEKKYLKTWGHTLKEKRDVDTEEAL